jgi:UDP-N-acetylmuramoyl-tripeptide--D-alanyl-D-alanine ligase
MRIAVADMLKATGGVWNDAPAGALFSGWSIDSRSARAGDIFFAITGDVQDGHAFVENAFAVGIAAAFVRHGFRRADGSVTGLIQCDDPLMALHDLASWSRDREELRVVVGITGSCGKTTTKDITAALLGAGYSVGKNIGNLNNIWGQPLAMLRRPDNADLYVCEMGMSFPGELRRVARIARPDLAVYTNISPVHLVNFTSIDDIAEAKAEMLEALKPGGPVIANADDPQVMRIARRSGHPLITYSFGGEADVRALAWDDRGIDGLSFELEIRARKYAGTSPLPGLHNLANLLAGLAAGIALGLDPAAMLDRMGEIELSPLRSHIQEFAEGWTLYNDAYNSNPAALRSVLQTVAHSARFSRRFAVLGDMLELGPDERRAHHEMGQFIAPLGFDVLITIGSLSVDLARAAIAAGMPAERVSCAETAAEATELLAPKIARGDLVLVKGSRGKKLERIVEQLMARYTPVEKKGK